MGNREIFDSIAKKYDSPERIKITNIITNEIRKHLNDHHKKKTAMDYGCGTGLIGLELVNEFKRMFLVDISTKMIECVDEKIASMQTQNAKAIHIENVNEISRIDLVDCILIVQTLLHIKDTHKTLQRLYHQLNENGQLIIIDFEKNNLVESDLVHNGFELEDLSEKLKSIGFKEVDSKVFYSGDNLFMNKQASMFLAVAKK